jgi:MtN3 and saliva related transmembrane protein
VHLRKHGTLSVRSLIATRYSAQKSLFQYRPGIRVSMLAQSLGWTATFLFTICYVPQIVKTVRTKTVDGLSIWLFRIQFLANIIALSYATLIGQRPLQIKYTLALILLGVVLFILSRFGKSKPERLVEFDINLSNKLYQIEND